ncbi:hypothetical protein [Dongia deserti]|uniref:hypothetical protein n=1 Tax=Dongia deserti TaxID=2268030 RepID=UPI000E652DAC|nr:hypothetical protein [Dongia deserti]
MLRTTILSAAMAIALPLSLGAGATVASAARDTDDKLPRNRAAAAGTAEPAMAAPEEVADAEATRPKQGAMTTKDVILYNIISDQISEMRRKSALPAVMCIAVSTEDGGAETISRTLMTQLEADNAEVEDSLFTLKHATECQSTGKRVVDRETHERAMMIVAGPMEADMKGLMSGCGDYVGGFVRATDDSDFDFYTVNGGAVARKLGCELAR